MRLSSWIFIIAAVATSPANATAVAQPQEPAAPSPRQGVLPKLGCSTRTYPLRLGQHSGRDEVDDNIRDAIGNIRVLRNCLAGPIRGQRAKQTSFDSGVIALGTASVATAFFTASIPAVGALAIAAQSLQQYRSYYNPETKGAALIKAVAGARCISSNAEPLLNAPRQQLWQSIANLQLAINDVHISAAALAGADAATVDASDATTKAITAANSALAALNAEAGAYNNAPSVIDLAHDTINDFIDRSNHRTSSPDVATIAGAINSGVKVAATADADAQAARTQLMEAFVAKAKAQVSSKNLTDAPAPVAASPSSLATANLPEKPGPQAVAAAESVAAAAVTIQQSATARVAVAKLPDEVKAAGQGQLAADAKLSEAVQAVGDAKAAAALQAGVDANAAVAGHGAAGPTSQNVSAVSALIAATVAALQQMPNPPFTTINNNITLCVASF